MTDRPSSLPRSFNVEVLPGYEAEKITMKGEYKFVDRLIGARSGLLMWLIDALVGTREEGGAVGDK